MTLSVDHDEILASWVSDVIARSGRQVTEIAAMLEMSRSSLSKIKGGQQQLKASQLLLLAERLDVPLPQLTKATSALAKPAPASSAGFNRALFDQAHAYVVAENEKLPQMNRRDQFQILEDTFHVYKTLMSSTALAKSGAA
jgi:transcriptional regulator with XRE-family HTH domain